MVFVLSNTGLAASPTSVFGLESAPALSLSPRPPSTMLVALQHHAEEELKVVKADSGLTGILNPAGFNTPLDFGCHRFSSMLRSCISSCTTVSTWTPSISLSHLVVDKQISPHWYFCTEQRGKLPAWMWLFEPCALKHGLVWRLFLTHSSSKAGFSEATERNVELGPQETRARQIYHSLLEGSISGLWHSSSPDSGIKYPPASKDGSKLSLH